jgi:hypothetical protein
MSAHYRYPAVCGLLLAGLATSEGSAQIAPAPDPSAGNAAAGWNISYQVPAQWQVSQTTGRLEMLASTSSAGAIFVARGMYHSFDQATADLSTFYQSLNLQAYPVEPPSESTIGGFKAMSATYASQDQAGRTVQGRFIALLTPHGTGLNLLAMTTAEQMPGLRSTLEQLAASVKAGPPQVNQQAVAALAGTWILYAGKYEGGSRVGGTTSNSHEETVVFDGRGSFQYQSTSSVMVVTPGYTGDASGASGSSDQGTYTVIGNTLVLQGTKGQFAVDYQLQGGQLTAAGKTYLRQ